MKVLSEGITSPKGFRAAGIHSGIKKAKKDLALIVSDRPAQAAGAYTQNKVQAAPVIWDKQISGQGKPVQAMIINSGNANACTGPQGMQDCRHMAKATAREMNKTSPDVPLTAEDVFVCSTGVIGVPLPMTVIEAGIQTIVPNLTSSQKADDDTARAILTTDTFKKEIAVEITLEGKPVRIAGIAKGSGMIHPDMATMLSFIVTDASVSHNLLQQFVGQSISDSYNMISVDGDTSTNDTVLVLANGASGTSEIAAGTGEADLFKKAFDYVHTFLAKQIVKDGEGAGKFLESHVKGALTKEDARLAAKSVITSSLVKTAFFGEDANWGRILCAVGYSGANINPETISLSLSSEGGMLTLLKDGNPIPFDEKKALTILKEHDIVIDIDLHTGGLESALAWGCDLSYDYVKINGEYRT
ncbi:MAG: bifunctional glutamate N-acetyltransferase/amino-acid acetyltransferase ArgJ [Spirochaetales bacterium]|jgi:glutamate N-acetyltransferase/amino-acid N-acetyltransferase|nr:bifunctional glutamate N-acetyltransferase/amino-acid acetyltransferase ArgJ [Spirochaetales bacterium]